jgi:hypothetical protein
LTTVISNNPDAYFATLAKQRLAENWATGKAAIESKLVKENSAFTAAQNIQLRQKEYELDVQVANWKRDQELWERANPKSTDPNKKTTTSLKDKDGNDINVPVGTDQENSIMYRGFSGIDITKTAATALDLFNKLQQQDYNDAHNLIFDQQGILGLAKNLGLNQEEIAHVATAFQKEVALGGDHVFTKEQLAATNKLVEKLLANEGVKKTGVTKITGPGTMRNALIAYAQDYFSQRNNLSKDGNDIPLDPTEFEALMRYMTGVEKLNRYVANESNREQLMQKNVINNPKYASLIVDRDGKKDLITVSDLAKDMKDMTLRVKRDGSVVSFSKEDLARLYMKGEIGQSKMGDIIIDGTVYEIQKFGSDKKEEDKTWRDKFDPSIGATADWNVYYRDVLVKKYGESSEFSKLIKTSQEAIVPDLLMYKGKSGQQGTAWTLYFMLNKTMGQGDKAAAIIDQALNMANADIYTASGERADAATMEGIRALLKSEKNMEDFIGAEYIPQGVNGQRTVRIVFSKPISEESKATIGDTKLQNISGKTFDLVLKEGATAPALDELPRSTGYQVYDLIARGKTFKSDPVVEASGFKFMVTPNVITSSGTADESPSYVTVDLEFNNRVNTRDPKTGQFTTKIEPKKVSQKIDLQGSNAKSPDEIVSYLYSLYYENMLANRNKQQEYETYIKTAQGASSAVDYNSQLRGMGLNHLTK